MNSTLKSLLFWMVLVVVGVLIWNFSANFNRGPQQIPFTTFLKEVADGKVAEVEITGNDIKGKYVDRSAAAPAPISAPTPSPSTKASVICSTEKGVIINGRDAAASPWANVLYYWAPILLMIGFWIFIMRQMQSGGNKALSFGKSRAKLSSQLPEEGHVQGRVGRRRGEGRAPGNHRVPEGTAEVPEARRPHPEGRAPHGLPGNRQDAARARRRGRGQRSVLLDQRLGLRRDVRRRRRLARPRPVRAGQEERPLHRLHRRDRRRRPAPRRRPRRRPRRARADAQPAPRRDGRVRVERGRHPRRRDQPARRARPGAAASRAASTAASSSIVPTSRAARGSSPSTPRRFRSPTT